MSNPPLGFVQVLHPLIKELKHDLFKLCERIRLDVYDPMGFRVGLHRNDLLPYITRLVTKPVATDGFIRIVEAGRYDLTVESFLVYNEKYHPLFEPIVIQTAQKRLIEYQIADKESRYKALMEMGKEEQRLKLK